MQELYIGLGSNLGDRRKNITDAIALIGQEIGRVTAVSSLVETEPWGFKSENRFLNCVIAVGPGEAVGEAGTSEARRIIGILQSIEQRFGRVRTGVYADRVIDLDILFIGDEKIDEPGLTVPHPKLHERDFVMIPLMELCPDKIHPVLGKSIRELWEEGS